MRVTWIRGHMWRWLGLVGLAALAVSGASAESAVEEESVGTVEADLGKNAEGSRTDDEAVQREEEAIKLDGLSVAQMKELRDKSEKFQFQAEVNRMMKLIKIGRAHV